MKIIFVLLVILCIAACGKEQSSIKNEESVPTSTQEILKNEIEVAVEHETFLEEDYVDYSGVENIIKFLKINSKDVKILHQTDQKLVFCFYHKDVNEDDKMDSSVYKYIREIETKEGIKALVYDATISTTFELEYDNYISKITEIIDTEIDLWKKNEKEWWRNSEENKKDEYKIDLIENENILCIVEKK